MSSAGFVVIGNEILSGKVVDTNSPYLAKELRKLGVDLERILTIPDEIDVIAEEVRTMHKAYDVVFTSGGIGPTHDDVTMEGVAQAFGLELILDQDLSDAIRKATGDKFNPSLEKMAMIPAGAGIETGSELWFPLVRVENVYVLPGIPDLFKRKFESIRDQFGGVPISLRRVFVSSFESDIAEILNALLVEFSELMIGSYPRMNEADYRVMITLESRDTEYLERSLASLLARLPEDSVHRVD